MSFSLNQKAKLGFYFHIPFCPHICPYCDFVKTSRFSPKEIHSFFAALEQQCDEMLAKITSYLNKDEKEYITVYFGGGTPGLFPASFYSALLEKLKRYFIIEEATIETNPHTNMEKNLHDYFSIGFDRVTLGAQSLCPHTLKTLGRKHTAKNVLQNIKWAREAGFCNIQVDLIYGLKKEIRTIGVDKEVEQIYAAGASGISAYALTIEKRTLFAHSHLADDNNAANEYSLILKTCHSLGLRQSEISHFSLYESKHNNIYWYGFPYIGIGTGAHGLLPFTQEYPYGMRYKVGVQQKSISPGNDLLIYSQKVELEKNFYVSYESPRTLEEYREEMFFTLLRTENGIPFSWLKEHFKNQNFVEILLQDGKIKRAIAEKKLILSEHSISLSAEEKIRGDMWTMELVRLSSCK